MTRHHPLRNFHVRFLCLAFAWSNFFGFGVAPAVAQDNDNSPASGQASGFASVAMAWSDARPLFYIDDKGAVTGLGSELAYAIGRELGFEIKPYRVPDFATWGHDQNSGVSEILPMAAKLPRLAENNFFSDVVFTSEVRFAVRVEDSDTFDYKEISGKRIGVLTPGAGSDPALYPGASILSFPNTRAALIALLSREIDAIATESGLTFAEAQAARLDQRIAFVGPPLEVLERVVIVHKTRVELLDPINDAIAKMKADGRIDDLVKRFRSRVPSVAPKVLKVPVAHLAPWMIVEDDSVRGFSVELVAEIANRSGLSIEFIPVSLKEYFEALDSANADLFPVVRKADKIGEVLDLTIPIQILPLEIVVRDTDTQLQTLADLSALRVGGFPDIVLVAQDNDLNVAEIIAIDDSKTLVSALENGEIDAILEVTGGLEGALLTEQLRSIGAPDFEAEIAIGLRSGLGVVRERLNVVIPGFLLSNEYVALREEYFSEPEFWTQRRVILILSATAVAFLLLLATFVWQRQKQRKLLFARQQQDLAREKAHAVQLGNLVTKLEVMNREQSEFTFAVSHDLMSPSKTIGMLISELEEAESLNESERMVLHDMKVTNSRMGQLVRDILDYSQVVHKDIQLEAVDCNELIDMIINDLRADVLQANAKITRTQIPMLRGQPMQLRMLFQNLISNAIKFRSPDRHPIVEITTEIFSDGIKINVSDNGIGIPIQHRERVFSMFHRLFAQSEYDGTGLGLAICRRIVSNHGGKICAKPASDEGTKFEIIFGKEVYG